MQGYALTSVNIITTFATLIYYCRLIDRTINLNQRSHFVMTDQQLRLYETD